VKRLLVALLAIVGKNAVPAAGLTARQWDASNAMLLFLAENIVLVLLGALLVRLRAPATSEERDQNEGETKTRSSALRSFFLVAVPFTFGATVITVFVIAIRDEYTVAPRELFLGFGAMLLFQFVGFANDLGRLRGITLAAAEDVLVSVLGRVFFLAFAVWLGLFVVMVFASAFFLPFVLLKTLMDVWRIRPEMLKRNVKLSF
jgi:hypothetical protein